MLLDLARVLPAALAAAVAPGYFWAVFLRPTRGLAERLAYSTVLSLALVPTLALVLARAAGTGVTLWVALVSAAAVLGSGAVAVLAKGPARTTADPVLARPRPITDWRVLAVTVPALLLALASAAGHIHRSWLLALIALALLAAGALAGRAAGQSAGQDGDAQAPPTPVPGHGPAPNGPGQIPAHASANIPGRAGTSRPGPTAGGAAPLPVTATDLPAVTANGATVTAMSGRDGSAGGTALRHGGPPALALPSILRAPALTIVLALTAFRAYVGVVRHDWPFLRGSDLFSHAVMAEQILSHGSYNSYLIYPPGFSALTAVISRFSGLPPLQVFPVLAPSLLVLTALGAYALATRLWGWEYGVAAAALSGLVLVGAYAGFAGGRYPDLIDAYFLVTMAVAALVAFFQAPTARSGALLTVVGAAVVLYHSVATLYLAVLLALAGGTALVYLLRHHHRGHARALLLSLAALVILSACYAVDIYGVPRFLGGGSATSTAVSIALGSQGAPAPAHLLAELAPAVLWLGAFSVAMLTVSLRWLRSPAQVLTTTTMLLWSAMMYLGSRTAADGFPQRFERDLGAPLSVIGALAVGVLVLSVLRWRALRRGTTILAGLAAVAVAAVLAAQSAANVRASARPAREVVSRPVAAAGAWLARHNTGAGTIISTPYMNPGISNRAVLAMGGYTGLQSYRPFRIAHPRSLPTAGRQPLLDSQEVLMHPASCRSAAVLARDDVRYVVLYKSGDGADLAGFRSDPARYRRVFENSQVVIYQPSHAACG